MTGVTVSAAAHRRRWWLRRSALGDVTAVLRTAATVLFGRWPVLFALAFAGLGTRHYLVYPMISTSTEVGTFASARCSHTYPTTSGMPGLR